MRGGNVNTNNQQLRYAGEDARYWSSRSNSDANNAYNLYFDGNSVNPSNNWNRYNGFSLRCLSRASISENYAFYNKYLAQIPKYLDFLLSAPAAASPNFARPGSAAR